MSAERESPQSQRSQWRMVEGGAPAALPAAVESEQAVLGSILRNREALTAVATVLTPDVFYQQRHADIYRAMLDLHARRMPPDLRTVAEALRQAGTLDRLGGLAYLAELADTPVTSYHIDAYVAPVITTARKRRLIAVGGQIAALGYGDREPDAAEADAQALLNAASLQTHASDVLSGTDATLRSWDRMMGEHAPTIMTGWSRLDDWTGGLASGDLMVIGARPGMGKTALAMSLMRYLCKSGQAVPLLFALEMSSDQIVHRFVAMETGVSVQALRKAVGLDERTLQQITTAHGTIGSWQWAVCDRSDLTPERVRARTAKHMADHPETVVIIDHLGLLGIDGKHENRTQDVASISLALKRLARENNIPVIALSQLNRAAETRGDKVPLAADLRDSGALEQDADIVAMLYREDFYAPTPENRGQAELYVRKNRHGPTGTVHLRFDGATGMFLEAESPRTPEGYA